MIRRLCRALAESLVRGPHREFVLGDLDEGYDRLAARRGRVVAAIWFVVMTLRSAYTLRRRPGDASRVVVAFRGLAGDLRHGWRFTWKEPAVSFAAAIVMALGTGVATLAYGIHQGTFRGLPVTAPDRMVTITSTIPEEGDLYGGVSVDDYWDLRAVQTTMDDIALWNAYEPMNFSTGDAPPEQVTVTFATSSLHRLLELTPMYGRIFAEEDDHESAPRVTVLTAQFWERRFGGDPAVIGRTVRLGGEAVTIVGVLPPQSGFEAEDLFLPVRAGPATPDRRARRPYDILGRLRATASQRDANEEFAVLAQRLSAAYPETNRGVSARVIGFAESRVGSSTNRLLNLTGALILFIAVANVANLFLVRALARSREFHLRLALGASRWRVVRHFLGEAVTPMGAGALGGMVFASQAIPWVGGPDSLRYSFQPRYAVFALAITVVAVLMVGLIAASQTIRRDQRSALADGTRGNTRGGFSRLGHALVVAEIALGGAGLFVAGLMMKTASNLERVEYGFAIEDVMTGTVQLDAARYDTPEKRLAFWDAFRARAGEIPGVQRVTLATQLPMIRYRGSTSFQLDGPLEGEYLSGLRSAITPEFFDTFEKTLLQGRVFTDADGPGAEPVVIVNEDFVRKFIPDGNALGRRIKLGGRGSERPWMRVVGVAPHMWMDTDVDRSPEGMYVPLAQFDPDYASIAIRVAGNPEDYREPLRETLMGLDPNLPLDEARTMATLIRDRTSLYRRVGPQYMFLGVAALVLSMVGLYGVMAYMARSRTYEMGIRLALGAQRTAIVRIVLAQGMGQIAAGVVIGVGVALYVSRGISRIVFQMTPWDPGVLVVSFGLLALTGVAATLVPAYRAARTDPLNTLRRADA